MIPARRQVLLGRKTFPDEEGTESYCRQIIQNEIKPVAKHFPMRRDRYYFL